MTLLVEQPIDGMSRGARRVLFDMGLCAEAVGNVLAKMICVISRVGDHMADARQAFDQSTGLGAIAPLAGRDRQPGRQAEGVNLCMDFCGQATFGSANTGSFKPPF